MSAQLRAIDLDLAHTAVTLDAIKRRPTVSVPEAAAVLGIGRNAAYEAIHRGEIEALRFGNRIVVPVAPLMRLIGIES